MQKPDHDEIEINEQTAELDPKASSVRHYAKKINNLQVSNLQSYQDFEKTTNEEFAQFRKATRLHQKNKIFADYCNQSLDIILKQLIKLRYYENLLAQSDFSTYGKVESCQKVIEEFSDIERISSSKILQILEMNKSTFYSCKRVSEATALPEKYKEERAIMRSAWLYNKGKITVSKLMDILNDAGCPLSSQIIAKIKKEEGLTLENYKNQYLM